MDKVISINDERPTAPCVVLLLPADPATSQLPELTEGMKKNLKAVMDDAITVRSFHLCDGDELRLLITAQAGEDASPTRLASRIVSQLDDRSSDDVQLIVERSEEMDFLPVLLRELFLMDYRFDQHKEEKSEPRGLNLQLVAPATEGLEALVQEQRKLAEAVKFTRRLVDEPANVMTPEQLAAEAEAMAREEGITCEIYDEEWIQAQGLEAYYSVAKGSDNPPRFIVLRYDGAGEGAERLALVGKGLCYDSGGYALKTASGMVTMHCDMAGAGAVIGAIKFLAAIEAPVNVTAVVAAAENMISGHAYKNGDIIGSLSGKTIEVLNTDAEGRVTLADAITYAVEQERADYVVDIATLTGAVIAALGPDMTGVMTDDERLWNALEVAAGEADDPIWRLPVNNYFRERVLSKRADLANSATGGAGTVTAGMFLREFALGTAWMHLDVAGTAYHQEASCDHPKGASGVGVEMLAKLARELLAD